MPQNRAFIAEYNSIKSLFTMRRDHLPTVGIDQISLYLPSLYLPIDTLAALRNLEAEKLKKGLGLNAMALCDVDENVITMAAEAVYALVLKAELDPQDISRIYVGTESSVDGSKPIATYVLQLMEAKFGAGSLQHCDVVDMTFACIGAVDAFQNCLDWVRLHPEKKAIVVATDEALYERGSSGEYTQGAGALALLIAANPSILAFEGDFGVSTESVLDFYKPLRRINTSELLSGNDSVNGREVEAEDHFTFIHKSTPVFDGQYSNSCYQNRIEDAFKRYLQMRHTDATLLNQWSKIVFHLPYAYHGRRICHNLFVDALIVESKLESFCKEQGLDMNLLADDTKEFFKRLTKTEAYLAFLRDKIDEGTEASSQVGNLYTGSIFLSLLSVLNANVGNTALEHQKIGFFAYGSGSKSKVFEGAVQRGWRDTFDATMLTNQLNKRVSISADQYEELHKRKLRQPISNIQGRNFRLAENLETNYLKYAYYFEVS